MYGSRVAQAKPARRNGQEHRNNESIKKHPALIVPVILTVPRGLRPRPRATAFNDSICAICVICG